MKKQTEKLKTLQELIANNYMSNTVAINLFTELLIDQYKKSKFSETDVVLEEIEKLNSILKKDLQIKSELKRLDNEYENLFVN